MKKIVIIFCITAISIVACKNDKRKEYHEIRLTNSSETVVQWTFYDSWAQAAQLVNTGDRSLIRLFQQVGQAAIKKANIDWNFTESDVDQMLSKDFAELFGLYSKQTEDEIKNNVPRGYTIETFKDALYATYNGDFYFTTDGSNCYVNKMVKDEKGEDKLLRLYKLHGNAQYYGFEQGYMYNLNADSFRMAHKDFAAALYATTKVLETNIISDCTTKKLNTPIEISSSLAFKSIYNKYNFSLFYSTQEGYSQTVSSFQDGTTVKGINDMGLIIGILLGGSVSEIVLECTDKRGERFILVMKSDVKRIEKEWVYETLHSLLLPELENTHYAYLLQRPNTVHGLTYINRQPLEKLKDGRHEQHVYLNKEAIIKNGFNNMPTSMEGCTIFKIFEKDGSSYYDIRTSSDYSKGSSILANQHINNDYDLCSYMRTFNVLFNEVPDKYDNASSIKMAQRWLFGLSEDEKKTIKDEDVQKWGSSYGKRKEKKLNDILKSKNETTRDRIMAAMLCGKIDTTDGEEIVNTDNRKEGMCYFTKDQNGHWWQHILFRTDGGNGWAEDVIDYSSGSAEDAKKTFRIQPFDLDYVTKQVKHFYITDFMD